MLFFLKKFTAFCRKIWRALDFCVFKHVQTLLLRSALILAPRDPSHRLLPFQLSNGIIDTTTESSRAAPLPPSPSLFPRRRQAAANTNADPNIGKKRNQCCLLAFVMQLLCCLLLLSIHCSHPLSPMYYSNYYDMHDSCWAPAIQER